MAFNHRFLLRLTNNLAVYALTFATLGIALWVADEILGWDILPDEVGIYVQAILIVGGFISAVLVVLNIMLSVALLAEAIAKQAQLPDYRVSQQVDRRFRRSVLFVGLAAIALLIGLQVTDVTRARLATREATIEFEREREQVERDLPKVLQLFAPPLRAAIAADDLTAPETLAALQQIFAAVTISFPAEPQLSLLVPAQDPYQYYRIARDNLTTNDRGNLSLNPTYHAGFPSEVESQAIDALFAGNPVVLDAPLEGAFLDNTVPSSWGLLTDAADRPLALAYVHAQFQGVAAPDLYHPGPERLYTN